MIYAAGDRTLVQIVDVKKEKKSVLIVPDEKKDFQIGKVVDSQTYASDEYVYTRKYAGLLIEYDGVEYVSLDPKEILAYSSELK